jgi:hypothetical protein
VTPAEMRKIRVKAMAEKAQAQILKGEIAPETFVPTKEHLDDGQFFGKFLENVNNKQFQQYFFNYNQIMFAKVNYHKTMRPYANHTKYSSYSSLK